MKFIVTSIEFDTDGDKEQAKKLQKEWIGKTFEAKNKADGVSLASTSCNEEAV